MHLFSWEARPQHDNILKVGHLELSCLFVAKIELERFQKAAIVCQVLVKKTQSIFHFDNIDNPPEP